MNTIEGRTAFALMGAFSGIYFNWLETKPDTGQFKSTERD